MRLVHPRWVLPLALLSILPLVALGWMLTERSSELNRLRYDQEVLAARYAGELASDVVERAAEEYFRPRSENLSWAHLEGEEKFQKTLRSLYFSSPLLETPQFVEEAELRNTQLSPVELARLSIAEDEHECSSVVMASLRQMLVEDGRKRLGYDSQTGRFRKKKLVVEEADAELRRGLRWWSLDLSGPLLQGWQGCEKDFARIGVVDDAGHVRILSLALPMPGRGEIRSGMFGAVIPAQGFLAKIVAPALSRWTQERGALPRHGLRVVDQAGTVVLPADSADDEALRKGSALYSEALLGMGSPWRLEVVALSGFDLDSIRRENRHWVLALVFSALLLALGAVLLARGFLHHRGDAMLRSHLMGNISHELKTPLSLIRLYADTLESGRTRDDEERTRFLQVIGRESKRLTHLIDNLLDVQRIESDRKQYSYAQVRPGRVVRQTVDSYRYQLTEAGFDLKVDVDEELPLLYVDEEALAQALINLLDNAAKYSDTVKEIRVACVARHGEVRISVQDRGIGIPASERDRIFESFYRVEKSNVHEVQGSGLGLAVVKHVAEHHGGHVDLDSTPGKGSTFTIVLPLAFDPGRD